MDDSEKEIEKVILTRLSYFNAVNMGLVIGFLLGGVIFLATIFLIIKGGPVVGPHLALLGQYFIGYKVTFLGSIVGFLYGLITGFIIGYFFARLYNWIAKIRERNNRRLN